MSNVYPLNEVYRDLMNRAKEHALENDGEISDYLGSLIDQAGEMRDEALFGMMYDIKNKEADIVALKAKFAHITLDFKKKIEKATLSAGSMKCMLASVLGESPMSDGIIKTTKAVSVSMKVVGDIPDRYIKEESVLKIVKTTDNAKIKKELINGAEYGFAVLIKKKSVM